MLIVVCVYCVMFAVERGFAAVIELGSHFTRQTSRQQLSTGFLLQTWSVAAVSAFS